MKPDYIFIVRHGESVGNAHKGAYAMIPDWKIPLTERGRKQANRAGEILAKKVKKAYEERMSFISEHKINVIDSKISLPEFPAIIYTSPWYRAKETAQIIQKHINTSWLREDPRLREQEWGMYQEEKAKRKIQQERRAFGSFFYRMPMGESGADTYDRITTFIDTMHRDFEKRDYPPCAIVTSHGLTSKVFLMRWFHWSVEEFDSLYTPKNCCIIAMKKVENDRYKLMTKLPREG